MQVVGDGAGGDDVEAVGGLVEDDDVWVVHQGDDEAEFLLHAGGEIGHLDLGKPVDAEAGKEALLACGCGAGGHAVQFAEEVVEIVGGEEVFQLQFAGEEGYLAAYLFGLCDDAAAVDPGIAAVGLDEGGEHAEGGGLAGPVGTQEAEYLTPVGGEGEVVYGGFVPLLGTLQPLLLAREGEGFAETFDTENFVHFVRFFLGEH